MIENKMKLTLVAFALCAVAAVQAETYMKETFDGRTHASALFLRAGCFVVDFWLFPSP